MAEKNPPASPSVAPTSAGADAAGLGGTDRTRPSTNVAPHEAGTTDETVGDATATPAALSVKHTRASATYIGVAIGLIVLVLVVIFIAQNTTEARVSFLGFHFHLAIGLIVLAAAVAGGLIVLLVSLARVVQLRVMARRHRHAHQP